LISKGNKNPVGTTLRFSVIEAKNSIIPIGISWFIVAFITDVNIDNKLV